MNRWTELHCRGLASAARAVLDRAPASAAFYVYADQFRALRPVLALPAPGGRA